MTDNIKKAQKIINEVDGELSIALVAYQRSELEYLRDQIDKLLDLEVDMDELHDADDEDFLDEDFDDEEDSDDC